MLGPQILDHLVRLQYVGPDLATEVNDQLLAAALCQLGLALLTFQVQPARGQPLPGLVLVLLLPEFVLALPARPGRQAGHAT